jgi:esterase/lipase
MKFKKWYFLFLLFPVILFLGPVVHYEKPVLKKQISGLSLSEVDTYITNKESQIKNLKPGNESEVVWFEDSLKTKTKYSVLYLHGFSASPYEGKELAISFGKKYGCNVYLPRLEDHGRADKNTFVNLTPQNYIQSAKDALDIARIIGDSVIVISCSTGATLGLILAAEGENIHSHLMYSPNIAIADKSSVLLMYPWGKQVGKLVLGGDYNVLKYSEEQKKYWNETYHINGLTTLQYLLDNYMVKEAFEKITHPVLLAYYFKDAKNQDPVVSVDAMLSMYNNIQTDENKKWIKAFPDAGSHMMISSLFSNQMDDITRFTFDYAEKILHLRDVSISANTKVKFQN